MKSLFNFKVTAPPLVSVFPLVFLALSPIARAVVPAPDGGYPGGNTAEGQNALFSLTTGGFNTAIGFLSLRSNVDGSFNTAVGAGTLLANTAANNTAIGAGALLNNTGGSQNTALGAFALVDNTTGIWNTAIGDEALVHNTSGNGNIALGNSAGIAVSTANHAICIGAIGQNVSDSCYIDNIYGAEVEPINSLVVVDANGKLGTSFSARRFKRDIQPMENASEAILALKPVTFHYRSDVKSTPCFGLVAEDVEKVNPHLVLRDKNGQLLSVRYEQINAMLLNEFLKEHRKVEEQQSKINRQDANIAELKSIVAQQQREMDVLTAQLKDHASQIQKVSAQLELRTTARRTVLNDQ
jgi:hypothetical protein